MTFSARETSQFGGEPLRLLVIRRGNLVWRYATGDRHIELDGFWYEAPGGIGWTEIRDSSQRQKNRITITLPIDLSVSENWFPYPTSGVVLVACLALHKDEAEYTIEWTGRVVGPKAYDTKLDLVCEPSRAITKSRGNNLRWQRGCPLAMYSQGNGMCNLDPDDWKLEAPVGEVDGVRITSTEFATLADGRLDGGFITWTRTDGEPDYRTIMVHLGEEIFVDYPTDSIPPAAVIDALPGCKHDWEDCTSFSNTDNYGGCRYIPVKSPHDGNQVQ